MHQLPENMLLMSLSQDHFSNSTVKPLCPNLPFLFLIKCSILTQICQKQLSQRLVAALFRETYAMTSKKHVSTKTKTRSFQ